jgi:hypothetical protein
MMTNDDQSLSIIVIFDYFFNLLSGRWSSVGWNPPEILLFIEQLIHNIQLSPHVRKKQAECCLKTQFRLKSKCSERCSLMLYGSNGICLINRIEAIRILEVRDTVFFTSKKH